MNYKLSNLETIKNKITLTGRYKYFFQFISFNFLVILFLVFGLNPSIKVDIRLSIFSIFDDSIRGLQVAPEKLNKYGFLYAKSPDDFEFKRNSFDKLKGYKILNFENDNDLVKQIVFSYSKGPSIDGCGFYSQDIMRNIKWVSQNHGCCSDYSQVFIALAELNGLFAREVHHQSHTFNEYWDRNLEKWVWLDANLLLMAKAENNKYLSLYEIREYLLQGKTPKWEYLGNENQKFFKNSPSEHHYYRSSEFQTLIYTNGNNVFQESDWNLKLKYFPKEVRQFILYTLKKMPEIIIVGEDSEKSRYFKKIKFISYALGILYLIINFFLIKRLIV